MQAIGRSQIASVRAVPPMLAFRLWPWSPSLAEGLGAKYDSLNW